MKRVNNSENHSRIIKKAYHVTNMNNIKFERFKPIKEEYSQENIEIKKCQQNKDNQDKTENDNESKLEIADTKAQQVDEFIGLSLMKYIEAGLERELNDKEIEIAFLYMEHKQRLEHEKNKFYEKLQANLFEKKSTNEYTNWSEKNNLITILNQDIDIWKIIFSFLSKKEIINFKGTCHFIWHMIDKWVVFTKGKEENETF